ncbi:RnfH family protein [Salinisphaera sp. SPP-AMP-43]|uniref:RnfH family protein n=1 Tax=Salinisphaera sp. SPP-AMP-43 TaxID=3121288 RepID=UPI003C6DF1CF
MVENVTTKQIEVVFAMPGRCWRESVRVAADATAEQAATASGLDTICREQTGSAPTAFGVFGRKIAAETLIGDGQRLELYRPLTADPRERRRRRAARTG